MRRVLRWGRSAYETDADLAREEADARALGLDWELAPGREPPDALSRADALVVTSGVRVGGAALARFRGDLVVTTTSGHDHIDVPACRARGVRVLRSPLARRDAVAEHAIASLAALMRRQPAMDAYARAGRWARAELPDLDARGLPGSRVLVVGLGVIGVRVAGILRAFGAEVLGVDPKGVPDGVREVRLPGALHEVDAVTLHCELTDTSRALLTRERLERLPSHAVVVNTARGEVLDVEAGVELVRRGELRGLAVDVFPVEPYPALALSVGASTPGVQFTPHASGFTRGLGARVADEVRAALVAWTMGGDLPNPVQG